ncbi:hypothetical protein Salat_2670200 [Sesamum alatum]|uniref:Myb/SANT-like domain-containing protein n=1 Tax=Sesamum alatum TaxID=300844 RepID=A0AAE1XPE3_9LAMI|nr:hypothetical protein Salat_2670200 [Sesamum alatum]
MANENAPPFEPPTSPPPFEPRPQRRYFYTHCWSRKHDNAFIRALNFQPLCGKKQLSRTPNIHSLMYGRGIVNSAFGWSFKYNVIKRRLECLRLRYTTLRTILETPGFAWDRDENVVHAYEEAWNRLENEFANAYHLEASLSGKSLLRSLHPDAQRKDRTELWQYLVMKRGVSMMRTMTMKAWMGEVAAAMFPIK